MADLVTLWLQYALASGLIVYAGGKTIRHADGIAQATGLGRGWIGLTIVAAMTSLPELITGASSLVVHDVPDIAVGDVYGSLVVNLLLVALVDALSPRPLFASLSASQKPRAWAVLALTSLAGFALAAGNATPRLGWIGVTSILLFAAYFGAIWLLRPKGPAPDAQRIREPGTLRRSILGFFLHGIIVVAAASYLPLLGTQLADATGLLHTSVGNLLVAASTSLPELVTTVAAVRLGAIDLAVGNLLGSNLFDVAILAIDDGLYTTGPLFAAVSPRHMYSAAAATLMSIIVLVGLHRKPRRKWFLSLESWFLVAVYAATVSAFVIAP